MNKQVVSESVTAWLFAPIIAVIVFASSTNMVAQKIQPPVASSTNDTAAALKVNPVLEEQSLALLAEGRGEVILDFWAVDSLIKVFQDATPEVASADMPVALDVARGECASLQIVFRSTHPVNNLTARMSKPFTLEAEGQSHLLAEARLRWVGYVPVLSPTQLLDPDQLPETPANYPDPLLEQNKIEVAQKQAQPIWVTVEIPLTAKPGTYFGEVEILGTAAGDAFVRSLPLAIQVYDVTVGPSRMWSSSWFSLQLKHMGLKTAEFSPEYWSVMRKFVRNLVAHRQNVVKVKPQKLGVFSVAENGEMQIDFQRFDQTVQLFIDEGLIGRIEGEPLAKRVGGWDTPFVIKIRTVVDGEIIQSEADPDSPEADEYCRWYLTLLAQHLKEKGWSDIYLQHLGDEPTKKTLKSYCQISKLARKYAPGMKLIDATHTHDLPDDTLDIWVPLLSTLGKNYDFFKQRRDDGAEIWTYVCLHPQGGWANRFMEQPLLKTRFLPWINFRYGISGQLNWGHNSWRSKDPFTQTTPKGGPGYLPAGDAWMIYPGPDGPLDSIRYEAWRDGIADNELLHMLAEQQPEAAVRIAVSHILSFKKYNLDVEAFRASRGELLELLGGVKRPPLAPTDEP